MTGGLRKTRWTAAIAAIYAVTALLLGFAHVHSAVAQQSSQTVAARSLPDGTPLPICGGGPTNRDGSGAPGHAATGFCDACLLTAAPGAIPSAPVFAGPPDRFVKRTIAAHLASAAKSFALSPQSRGPPQA